MSCSRRRFLKSLVGASTVVSLSPTLPAFLGRAALAGEASKAAADTVLVVTQLSGGNDGLNTVVPYADDAYGRSRPTLRLTKKDVLCIDSQLGFHPAAKGFERLFREGHLSVVQGVGYPKSNRDHNEGLRHWHTARPTDDACQTGWLGRAIDGAGRGGPPSVCGVCVAPIPQPFVLNAERSIVPTVAAPEEWVLRARAEASAAQQRVVEGIGKSPNAAENPLAEIARRGTLVAHASSKKVEAVLQDARPAATYPGFELAKQMKAVVELMRADIGIRIFFTEIGGGGIGGFDNHANQRDNHAALLRELSESVAALVDDLRARGLLDRVLLMTFSEFGRTLKENGRRGTDHGAAQPVFLAGGRLKGGLVGAHPSLRDLDGDAPRHHTDFRCLYATALESWLRFDSAAVLGEKFKPLDVLRA